MIKITDQEFTIMVDYLKSNYGINLANKKVLLEGRLNNYIVQKGFKSYTDYISAFKKDKSGHELSVLLNKVTTNHTFFMREAEHFSFLANTALPRIEQSCSVPDLRIWCAASSTGQEAYTIAMILEDYFGAKIPKWDKVLLASDISTDVLDTATKGIYPTEDILNIPEVWKKKYFVNISPHEVQICDKIKSQVIFKQFNLMDPISFKKPFHVIFCRNVMIYFDKPTKIDLINRFYNAIAPGGYLLLGQTESIPDKSKFNYVMPSVYQKPF